MVVLDSLCHEAEAHDGVRAVPFRTQCRVAVLVHTQSSSEVQNPRPRPLSGQPQQQHQQSCPPHGQQQAQQPPQPQQRHQPSCPPHGQAGAACMLSNPRSLSCGGGPHLCSMSASQSTASNQGCCLRGAKPAAPASRGEERGACTVCVCGRWWPSPLI